MIQSTHTGDWQQIKELSRIWQRIFLAKEAFIQKAMDVTLNPYQYAELELSLALITGNLKEVDAKIHYLMFGGAIEPNEIFIPIREYFQIERNKGHRKLVKELLAENQKLISENNYLKHSRDHFMYKSGSNAKSLKKKLNDDHLNDY